MPRKNFYYKMNVDGEKGAGLGLHVEIITKTVTLNTGERIQNIKKDP